MAQPYEPEPFTGMKISLLHMMIKLLALRNMFNWNRLQVLAPFFYHIPIRELQAIW